MASPPESTPDKNNNNEYSEEKRSSSDSSDSSNSSPSSSQSTSSSPPPNSSPPPPPPQKSPPPPPPRKSSSPPPPPPESPSPPPPQQDAKPPSSSSPPPQQESVQPTATPNVAQSPPPKPTTPVILPLPTTTPNPVPIAAATAPGGVFYPPPPIGSLSPASSATKEKSPSSSNQLTSGSKPSPAPDHTQSTVNSAIIAGITAACVLLIALIILTITCLFKKKKQYRNAPPKGGDQYYGTQTQWHGPEGHVVQIPPPQGVIGTPGGGGGGGGGGGWMQLPTSSEFSSNSSGHAAGHQTPPRPGQQSPNMGLGFSKSQFTYEELAAATGGFSQANLLGQGGFGYVYKGVLPNGQIVAVKSLKSGSGQGEREFQAEVEIISRVHHRHLVSLVGYCIADGQRMLVYEYVSNKTMEFHLHGAGRPVMDWPTRLRIALGSAKGLGYLHEDCHPKIIHRDIKAANILLDDKYEAMVADFGLAKLSEDNNTHVSTRVMGTFGYLAPEYASSGKLTEKSDVFSFGVMLLELITGRRPVDNSHKFNDDSLVDWARPVLTKAIEDGNYKELVDPRLEDNYDPDEMVRMVACAAACIRHSARRRPKMTQIVRTLDGDSSLDDLNEAGKAGQVASSNGETQVYDTGAYNADMLKFKQLVMSSQEFISGEITSESTSSSSGDSCSGVIDSVTERQKL